MLDDEEEGAALRRIGRPRDYPPGVVLFHQGDPSDHALFILRGRVKVTSVSSHGRRMLLAVRGPGDIVGELSAVDYGPRSATATAVDPLATLVITAEEFSNFLLTHPRTMHSLLVSIIGRLRDADTKRLELGTYQVRARIAQRLLELVEVWGVPTEGGILIDLPLTQQELADWTGASQRATASVMRSMRNRGVLATRRRHFMVRDLHKLQRLAR